MASRLALPFPAEKGALPPPAPFGPVQQLQATASGDLVAAVLLGVEDHSDGSGGWQYENGTWF